MACELLNVTTIMALSVVNDLKVIMPLSLRFSMYSTYHFLEMVEGYQSIDMLNAHLVSLKAQMR